MLAMCKVYDKFSSIENGYKNIFEAMYQRLQCKLGEKGGKFWDSLTC